MPDTSVILPQNPDLVTADVVQGFYDAYRQEVAERLQLEIAEGKAHFSSVMEKELEIEKRILDICTVGDLVHEGVRVIALDNIATKKLHTHSPEEWDDLTDMIREAMPALETPSRISQLAAIAEFVAPYAKRIGADVYKDPKKLGYLEVASSALKGIVMDKKLSNGEKQELFKEELDFIFNKAKRRLDVNGRYRTPRHPPATGTEVMLPSGEKALLLVGNTVTITAITHRLDARVVKWNGSGKAKAYHRERPSKLKGEDVHVDSVLVSISRMTIVDSETGEVTEVEV